MRTGADEELRPLILRCLAGEAAAQRQLVDRFQGGVFGLCYRMLGHRQDAEDTAQETFVRVLKSLHQYDLTRDFEPWLLAIAGNRCRTALATRKRRVGNGLAGVEELPEHLPDRAPPTEDARNLGEEVTRALAQVREEYRRAFVLFHEQELSYAEIADDLAVPLGTVKTWVHRARKEIIDQLRRRGVVGATP